ncbi:hypothetical protein Deipe_4204 (plasmid) [Deinococcus peraridilitoris DSM 19664]|uniref:Uncharacterized protein n=1 Tax=Deinococcus peraridilitoris (strain DSM 19664 / LMG 22246 / CIP 109416 / KR-200) TaxID=937777 RepID=L0A6V3_DEIPD|nr:hypothetical protein Deipe_4204 [Deinococcus peraridilitoris DSM 19664]
MLRWLLCIPPLTVACAAPALPAPVVWLVDGASGVYGTTQSGDLFTWQAGQIRLLHKAFALSPLIACDGGVVGVNGYGELQRWTAGQLVSTSGARLSALSRPACVPDGLVAVAMNGDLVRYETRDRTWRETARVQADALPDAQLTLADLTGNGTRQIVALRGPNRERYRHGILGDTVEATGIGVFDSTHLALRAKLTLGAPDVFEDLEARPLRTSDQRDALVVVRSSAQGGSALAVIEQRESTLHMRSLGPDFQQPNRWLAPIVGLHAVWAVHTPHLGGVLHHYQERGGVLSAFSRLEGVSNHVIGSRNLSMAVALSDHQLVLPTQDRQRLLIIRCASHCSVRQELNLDAPLSSNLIVSGGQLIAGDESGQIHRWPLPAF